MIIRDDEKKIFKIASILIGAAILLIVLFSIFQGAVMPLLLFKSQIWGEGLMQAPLGATLYSKHYSVLCADL